MNLDAWTVGASGLSATHESGFSISVEGNPKDPSAVNPGRFPAGLTAVEQARLLRLGMEAIAKRGASVAPAPKQKPLYVAPANKPERKVLSLKKKVELAES